MIKFIFLMIGISTFILNLVLTYYLVRSNAYNETGNIKHKPIVSFDLSECVHDEPYAEVTTALDTAVMVSDEIGDR